MSIEDRPDHAAEAAFNPYLALSATAAEEQPAAPPTRPRAGRPTAGPAKREHRVGLSLSDVEHAAWSAAAKDAGVGSLARWARERVTSSLALAHLGHSDLGGEVAALRADLGRVGSNLNQIARALNVAERGGPDGPTAREALDAIEAVRAQLAEVRTWTREHP